MKLCEDEAEHPDDILRKTAEWNDFRLAVLFWAFV
jgi:hypothetical protein